ncbi:netrin receptor unc-40-like isoform X2 [Amblyomma americanum]
MVVGSLRLVLYILLFDFQISELGVTRDPRAPSQVQNFSYRIVGDVTVRFTWEKPANTNGPIDAYCFDILNQDRNETAIIDVPGDARDRALNFTYPFSQFNVTLAAYNRDALNEKIFLGPEIEVSFETLGPAPSKPLNMRVDSAGRNWVFVQWLKPKERNGPLSGYNISVSSGTDLFSATTTETSHNCTELASGTTYMVSVYAFNQMNSVTKRGPTVSAQVSTRYNDSGLRVFSGTTILFTILISLMVVVVASTSFFCRKLDNSGEALALTSAGNFSISSTSQPNLEE